MQIGKAVGYGLVSLADSIVPPVAVILLGFSVAPAAMWTEIVPYVLGLGGLVYLSTMLVSFWLIATSGKLFPLTREFGSFVLWLSSYLPPY